MKIFLIILALIIFLPLPIKISILYTGSDKYIKIYNKNLLTKKETKKNKKTKKSKGYINKNVIMNFLSSYSKSFFKPFLYLNGICSYSLGDAAKTAVSYGVIHTYLPLSLWIFNLIFNVRKFKFPVNLVYSDDFIFNTKIKCIIFVSLAQVINMLISLIKIIYNERAVNIKNEQ